MNARFRYAVNDIQTVARGLEGCPFRVEDLCLRVEETPACREVAADLCALLRRQDI